MELEKDAGSKAVHDAMNASTFEECVPFLKRFLSLVREIHPFYAGPQGESLEELRRLLGTSSFPPAAR